MEGSGHAVSSTIYRHSSITMRATTTKMPHLLCEKIYLKPRMECLILFTIYDLFTKNVIWWGWEKNLEIQKRIRKPRKNFPFSCPPITPSTKWRPTVFRCPKTPKTSRTCPNWYTPHLMLSLTCISTGGRDHYVGSTTDIKQWWCSSKSEALDNVKYLFISIAIRSALARSNSTWKVLSMVQMELFDI